MRDRQPTKVLENGALRYGVYDETGALLRYEYLALEDAPSDVGTDLSKANLLTDDTETALFGSAADRTVNDALAGIAGQLKLIKDDVASITVTLKDSAGAAIPGVLVQGILSESGQAVYSSDSGVVSGYIPEGSQTIKVTGYADIADYSETISVTKGTSITKTITLTTVNFLKITSSKSVKFSGNVNRVDVSAVGGGGGAGAGAANAYTHAASGGGGGSGCVSIQTNVTFSANVAYSAMIGAAGLGAKYSNGQRTATAGGQSSFLGVSANGGSPGSNAVSTFASTTAGTGGTGGRTGAAGKLVTNSSGTYAGNNGVAGFPGFYSSFTETTTVAGSGASGGVKCWISTESDGGTAVNGGGNGGKSRYGGAGTSGSAGTGGGGGSGGVEASTGDGETDVQYIGNDGNGGSGCVAIRMHLKSAA